MAYTPWTRKKLNEARTNISTYTSWKKPSTLIREIQEAYTGLENYDLMLSYDDLEQGKSYDRIMIANVDTDTLEPYIKWGRKKAAATRKSSPGKSALATAEYLAAPDQTVNLINVIRRRPDALSGLRYYARPSTNDGRTKYIAEELSRKLSCMVVADRIVYNGWLPEHKHFICTCYHGTEPLRDVWNENPRPLNESIGRKTQYTPKRPYEFSA